MEGLIFIVSPIMPIRSTKWNTRNNQEEKKKRPKKTEQKDFEKAFIVELQKGKNDGDRN